MSNHTTVLNMRRSEDATIQELAIKVMRDAEKIRRARWEADQTDKAIARLSIAERQEGEAEMPDATEQILK
jgi:hypothetical protein